MHKEIDAMEAVNRLDADRRKLLCTTAATAALAIAPSPAAAASLNLGYVDSHSHLWSPERHRYPLRSGVKEEDVKPRGFTAGDLFSHARSEGVTRMVVVGHTGYFGYDASYLIEVARARPGEVAIQAFLDHTDGNAVARMAELKAQGVKAFRLRLLDPSKEAFPEGHPVNKVYDFAARARLVICPLTNPDWLPELGRLSSRHPATVVAIDHFARIGVDGFGRTPAVPGTIAEADVDNLLKLADHPMVHVKLSAFYALGNRTAPYDDMIPLIRKLLAGFGPERLMWGSDCPYQLAPGHAYKDSIAVVRDRLDGLTEGDREWLLRRTAERVFFT